MALITQGMFAPAMQSASNFGGMLGEMMGGSTPQIDPSNPASLMEYGSKLLQSGDVQRGTQLITYGRQMLAEAEKATADKNARMNQSNRASLDAKHGYNDALLEEAIAKKKKVQDEKRVANLTKMVNNRLGPEHAKLVSGMTPENAEAYTKKMLDKPDRDTAIESLVNPETGDTERVVVDKETGENLAVAGISKKSSPEGANSEKLASAESVLTAAFDVLNDDVALRAYSGGTGLLPTVLPKSRSGEKKIKTLISRLQIEDMQKMKGVLSDSDMKVLEQAATSLTEAGDLDENAAQVEKIISKMQSILGKDDDHFANGARLKRDAQGNMAWMYDDGSYVEVK